MTARWAEQMEKAFCWPSAEGNPQDGGKDEDLGNKDEKNWNPQEDHFGHPHTDHINRDISTGQLQDSQNRTGGEASSHGHVGRLAHDFRIPKGLADSNVAITCHHALEHTLCGSHGKGKKHLHSIG